MAMRIVRLGIIAIALLASRLEAQPAPEKEAPAAAGRGLLFDGVRAFRAERYEEALTLFQRIAAAGQAPDIGFYLGMSLHKLGRHAEALAAFRAARRSGLREPVADYYQAVSCYRLGMLERARQGFRALGAPLVPKEPGTPAKGPVLGPRLQLGAQRFLQAIEHDLAEADAGSQQLPAPAQAQAQAQAQSILRRYEAALLRVDGLLSAKGNEETALEWLDEAALLLAQAPERGARLRPLQQDLERLRETLRGKPAESEVLLLRTRIGGGGAL